jgi:hypothetical protein
MAGEWWDSGQFNLGGGSGFEFDPNWFNFDPNQFNLGGGFDPSMFFDPSQFNLGFDPGAFNFNMLDPLALPSFDMGSFQPAFAQQPGMEFGGFGMPAAEGMAGAPQSLADLGFGGGGGAPSMTLPPEFMQGTDPIPNLMGSDAGQAPFNPFAELDDMGGGQGTSQAGGGNYASPFSSKLNIGGSAYADPEPAGTPSLQDLQRQLLQGQIGKLDRENQPASKWDVITKLAGAFGPTAIGAAGMGLQAANRPQRNPLEDELIRAKIASTGLQDTLSRDRLNFERENAEAMRASQEEMQGALLESRKPGGQGNVNALLQGNPSLAALYQALTKQGTSLASGDTPEFNAQVEQLAQVDIAELQRQAQQQIAQAMEMAQRQGINPANIIAEIQQRVLQESAKARANARQTLIQQLSAGMQPGTSAFNSIGGVFSNLFQTPSA